jgi:hypothetical protein
VHSIECAVSRDFAWNFWTNVENLARDPDVESIALDGPFAAGTRGVTHSKVSGRLEWRIAEAQPGRAVIEFPLEGAVGRCTWVFEDHGEGCRITQSWTLEGEQGESYAKMAGPLMESGVPEGMKKLGQRMEDAARAGT